MNGDKNTLFTDWVQAYTDTLYDWAYFRVSSVEDAEDLVQETFVAALKAYDNFQGKSRPKTWLFAILNNKISDYFKQKSKKGTRSLEELTAIQITDSEFDEKEHWASFSNKEIWDREEKQLLDNPEFLKVLDLCLQDLPHKWHSAISAKYFLQKEASEICQELEISATNYWQIIHRAKLLLKKCIEANWA